MILTQAHKWHATSFYVYMRAIKQHSISQHNQHLDITVGHA